MPRKPKDPKAAERKARQREAQRRSGMVAREVVAHRDHWPEIDRLLARLRGISAP